MHFGLPRLLFVLCVLSGISCFRAILFGYSGSSGHRAGLGKIPRHWVVQYVGSQCYLVSHMAVRAGNAERGPRQDHQKGLTHDMGCVPNGGQDEHRSLSQGTLPPHG